MVSGAHSVSRYVWSRLAALARGCCPALSQKGEDWPHRPPPVMLPLIFISHFHFSLSFSVTIWVFLKLWLLPHLLPLSQKVLDNFDFSQHSSKWPTTLVTPGKLCRGAQRAWVQAQHFLKSHILVSIHPLFSEIMQDYSESHLGQLPILLPLCTHSQSVTEGVPITLDLSGHLHRAWQNPTYLPSSDKCEQEASFSKGFVMHPEMKKAAGGFWCPSMAWDLPLQLVQRLLGVYCKASPSCSPPVPQPLLCTFSLCSWHLQYKPLRL